MDYLDVGTQATIDESKEKKNCWREHRQNNHFCAILFFLPLSGSMSLFLCCFRLTSSSRLGLFNFTRHRRSLLFFIFAAIFATSEGRKIIKPTNEDTIYNVYHLRNNASVKANNTKTIELSVLRWVEIDLVSHWMLFIRIINGHRNATERRNAVASRINHFRQKNSIRETREQISKTKTKIILKWRWTEINNILFSAFASTLSWFFVSHFFVSLFYYHS